MKIKKRRKIKICPCCNKGFFKKIKESKTQWNRRLYCSVHCGSIQIPYIKYKKEKLKYLMNKVTPTKFGCLEWNGNINKWGYGMAIVSGKHNSVHRHIWELLKGEIPKGLCVLHKCDNRKCINISHLFLGTHQDNSKDMVFKGRQAKGISHGMCKIYGENKLLLFKMIHKGMLYKDIAHYFKVNPTTISKIARNNKIFKLKKELY